MAMDAEWLAELRAKYAKGWTLTVWEQGTVLQALGAVTRERDQLRGELTDAREALEAVEWEDEDGRVTEAGSCHWCHGTDETHFADCAVGTALNRPECREVRDV